MFNLYEAGSIAGAMASSQTSWSRSTPEFAHRSKKRSMRRNGHWRVLAPFGAQACMSDSLITRTPKNRLEGEHARSEVMGQQVKRREGNPIGIQDYKSDMQTGTSLAMPSGPAGRQACTNRPYVRLETLQTFTQPNRACLETSM